MTAFDRFEHQLPELMTDLASAHVPDYFDDMLTRTARTRQRPAWASLERWLPMGVIAQSAFVPPVRWRSIGILVILGLLIAAGALIFVGSRPRLPDPFGPARNGSILYSTSSGDIHSVDSVTGISKALVTGPTYDSSPSFSRGGTTFSFLRNIATGKDDLYIANADGSNVRPWLEGQDKLSSFEWSPDGTHAALTYQVADGTFALTILSTDGSPASTLSLDMDVFGKQWRPNGRELVVDGETRGNAGLSYGLYVVNIDGTGLRPLLPRVLFDQRNWFPMSWSMSPDGSQIAYSRRTAERPGRIHILDVDTGVDRPLEFVGTGSQAVFDDLDPVFSPDGKELVLERYSADGQYRLVVGHVDGRGPVVETGPQFLEGENRFDATRNQFSPDGTQILATYNADKTTWILDAKGGSGRKVSWFEDGSLTWQRLAP
jgi:Tol biopolymer transport system component